VNLPRCSGILVHPTSLPSRFGVGDFGPETIRFIDQLAAAGQTVWQVLPLGPVGWGNSPYQSYSAFAGEVLFISPELLVKEGTLDADDLQSVPEFSLDRVDYGAVRKWKIPLLEKAYKTFAAAGSPGCKHLFAQFCADHGAWLDDYALFVVLRAKLGEEKSWTAWDKQLARRNAAELARVKREYADEIERQKYWQFVFYRQWDELRRHCAARGISVMGDIPIYVAQESSDVWAHSRQFMLDENGCATAVSGVPPDYFSETGQRWGNPIYNWAEMERSGFLWWIERFRGTFRLYDVLRVDHFRGFEAYWEVPATEDTAVNGRWVKAPGAKLFRTVEAELGRLEIVAEDLGDITPEVEALRKECGFPGMAILQFAFGIEGNAANYRPHNLEREVIAYTGTHDNDTIMGWWNSSGGDSTRSEEDIRLEREFTLAYLGGGDEPMNWRMIRAYYSSVAHVAMVPIQDVLGLGTEARMNKPGIGDGNWGWRMRPGAFSEEQQSRLHQFAAVYDRIPKRS
jgi:4-alpha-glucanotransferase